MSETAAAAHTILIVDDEEGLRKSIAFDFRRKNFRVLIAASGNEAIETLKREKVDIVLSDVRMPDGTGLDLLDWVKGQNVFLPVVMFITAFADISVAEAYDRGAEAIFAKPFDRQALYEAVVWALRAKPGPEQRSSRLALELPVEITVTGEAPLRCVTKNIGRGGIFVAAEGTLPAIGDDLQIVATLEGKGEISGSGKVRWVRARASEEGPVGYGIEFRELNEISRNLVAETVNFLKTKSYIPSK